MCDRCYKNDWQHFVGDKPSSVHVRSHGGANVQGRGNYGKNYNLKEMC